jgi:hypothetical protein
MAVPHGVSRETIMRGFSTPRRWRRLRNCPQTGFEEVGQISNDKWDEQVLRIGETVPHEKASAATHRGSSTQAVQGQPMSSFPVSARVNRTDNDDAEWSAPVEIIQSQGSFFRDICEG